MFKMEIVEKKGTSCRRLVVIGLYVEVKSDVGKNIFETYPRRIGQAY